ncbi:MAG: hypothetical protein OHK0046_10680 [Anaerolineae bacterium]
MILNGVQVAAVGEPAISHSFFHTGENLVFRTPGQGAPARTCKQMCNQAQVCCVCWGSPPGYPVAIMAAPDAAYNNVTL